MQNLNSIHGYKNKSKTMFGQCDKSTTQAGYSVSQQTKKLFVENINVCL